MRARGSGGGAENQLTLINAHFSVYTACSRASVARPTEMDPAGLMQIHLRQNNDELLDYLKGLDSWEEEMKEKDEKLTKNKSILKEVTT